MHGVWVALADEALRRGFDAPCSGSDRSGHRSSMTDAAPAGLPRPSHAVVDASRVAEWGHGEAHCDPGRGGLWLAATLARAAERWVEEVQAHQAAEI